MRERELGKDTLNSQMLSGGPEPRDHTCSELKYVWQNIQVVEWSVEVDHYLFTDRPTLRAAPSPP